METPNEPIEFVPAKGGDTFKLGTITIRVMEDGSHTDNRLGIAEFTLPPQTKGPPPHWHEMHDETFLVTEGKMNFHGLDGKTIESGYMDLVVVPTRSPHTFSNPFDEQAKFINTYSPAFYINYFKLLSKLSEEGKPMNPETNRKAMAYFATIGVAEEEMKMQGKK